MQLLMAQAKDRGQFMTFDEFETAAYEIADTFPEDFYRELNGGIFVKEQAQLHPADLHGDLFVMGEYHRDYYLGRFIVLYYGSFMRCCGSWREEALLEKIRKVLLHEFRHHLESLAGERDLEIEDAIQISQYTERALQGASADTK
ncbi:MAG: metallopeptidase family protein [Lachnospiraceae bacterium]|nr:metallopeptidase family protein [Lachnospiraceae bacterium]